MLVPAAGERRSQEAVAWALQSKLPLPMFNTPKVCGGSTPPPSTARNAVLVWLSSMMPAGAETSKLTGIDTLWPLSGLRTVIDPE